MELSTSIEICLEVSSTTVRQLFEERGSMLEPCAPSITLSQSAIKLTRDGFFKGRHRNGELK